MIWVMNNGGKRRWDFKFIGFGEEEELIKSLERLDFKKLTLSLNFIGVSSLPCVRSLDRVQLQRQKYQ